MKIVLIIVGAVIIAVAGLAGGYFYGKDVGQKASLATYQAFLQERLGGQAGQAGGGQFPGGAAAFGDQAQGQRGQANGNATRGGATGEVVKVEAGKVTLTTPNGDVVVLVDDQTTLRKTTTITVKDLQPGETLVVVGDRDPQGNLVARSIQIGGAQFGGLPAGGTFPGGTPPSGNAQQRRPTQTVP
jgi:hypothetical protein